MGLAKRRKRGFGDVETAPALRAKTVNSKAHSVAKVMQNAKRDDSVNSRGQILNAMCSTGTACENKYDETYPTCHQRLFGD